MSADRENWPVMVQLGLWRLPTRASAWACFWFSMAVAVGSIAYGFIDPRFFFGTLIVFAALWYYLSIRWVDKHGRWS